MIPAMQITDRVGHIAIRVPDLDEAIAFHGEVLGFVETAREGPVSYLTCNDRHHELILIEQGQGEARVRAHRPAGAPIRRRSSAPGRGSPPPAVS